MAKAIAVRTYSVAADTSPMQERAIGVDTSLTSSGAYEEVESSARLITPLTPAVPASPMRPQPGIVTMPARPHAEPYIPASDEPSRFATHNRRAEAWERERERELRAIEHRPDSDARRRSIA